MEFDSLNQRGQASVEYLLVLLLAIIFIAVITQPNVEKSQQSMMDTVNFSELRLSAEKLSSSIEYVSVSGEGTRQTIQVLVPDNATLSCGANAITITYELQSYNPEDPLTDIAACPLGACSATINVGKSFVCTSGLSTKGNFTATIEKTGAGTRVSFSE